jgi:UDP-glucose 4-epimerase
LIIRAPPNFYAASKLAFEQLARTYTARGELPTVGLRYFSIYGPGEETKGNYANMISQFLWGMRRGESPIVYGDGTQTRDFTHVEDVVRANLLALETKAVGEVINVGTGCETSINSLVRTLAALLGKEIAPAYAPNPIRNYVSRTLADTSKAEKLLGFRATIPFREGVARLVAGGQ